MKHLFIFLFLPISCIGIAQNQVGYFNYGKSGKMSWSNHVAVNQSGNLIMAGYYDGKPNFVVANSTGTYVTSRSVASEGELFGPAIDNNGNIFVGGYYGTFGTQQKYIVKYTSAMAQSFARSYGPGTIRYVITDETDVVATGFSCTQLSPGVYENKACVLKINNSGGIVWYKEFTIDGKQSDAFVIEKSGGNYYVAGTIYESGAARSYIMALDAATGTTNWIRTYFLAGNAPHITGMSLSPTGIILCGATAKLSGGKMLAFKIDYSGNVQWTRLIDNCYSWYQQDQATYNIWGINCAVDIYGAVIVAYEDNPNLGMLAKLNESTGSIMWMKKIGNSGDGYHSIAAYDCTYLATGWFGPTIGSTWDYGLTVMDTSGFAGSCATAVTRTSTTPALTVATAPVTSVNLSTNTPYASAQNTTETMSHNNVCSTVSSTCFIPLPVGLSTFYGKADCSKETNVLYWSTVSETKNDFFTIEKSMNGIEWEIVTHINGTGTSSVSHDYSVEDAITMRNQIVYYRLLQTDQDGRVSNPNAIIALSNSCMDEEDKLFLFPNPVNDVLSIVYVADNTECANIFITDAFGKVVLRSTKSLNKGVNIIDYSSNEFSKGIYILSFETKSGRKNVKFIKN